MLTVTLRSPHLNSWDVVYITGSHPALGEWNSRAVRLDWHDGVFRKEINIPSGVEFDYLLTHGSWRKVECHDHENEQRPHHAISQRGLHLDHVVKHWGRDSVRYHVDVRSKYLPHPHTVAVHLPSGYDLEPNQHYPVIYLHDGQNVFDAHTAFAGVAWECDESAERLQRQGAITPIIQVAVANTPDRIREYAPQPGHSEELASRYARFLIDEVKSFIDHTYRTKREPQFTGICGSSLGGLSSLFLTREYPDVFGRCAAMSPSLWWDNEAYLLQSLNDPRGLSDAVVWIDVGGAEGFSEAGRQGNIRRVKQMATRLGYPLSERVTYVEVPDGLHNEGAWAARYPDMLRFLFPTWL